ncbi:hypothetical protein CK203_063856 [Vitis vinifera]|uniref:Uncharacterized protein n=1 Tax=Vitis vinifera TaxID=29760 RepID=A0A438G2X0_VITVI|nr:hypothetical protein CK203_063856 [Vitis vinifera]
MIMRSFQPRFARHLMGFPHVDFGSLVQALYGIEKGHLFLLDLYLPHIYTHLHSQFMLLRPHRGHPLIIPDSCPIGVSADSCPAGAP